MESNLQFLGEPNHVDLEVNIPIEPHSLGLNL